MTNVHPHDSAGVVYVALGDSISIDDYAGGPGRGGASLLARNLDSDFPQWSGHDLGGPRWLQLATDGGTTASLLQAQLPRLQQAQAHPSIVTVTVGGNDVMSVYGDTRAAKAVIATVAQRMVEALDWLHARKPAPERVVVGTAYDPSDGTGDTGSVGLPPWPAVVDTLAELNQTLHDVSTACGAAVADIHGRFLGHGLSRGHPGQHSPRPADRDLWYCDIIEPNAWGANAVRSAFWEGLGHRPPPG